MTVAWVFPGQGSQKIGMAKQIEYLPKTKEDEPTAHPISKAFEFGSNSSDPDIKDSTVRLQKFSASTGPFDQGKISSSRP